MVLGAGLVEGASHFPNPDWQPVAQNAAVLPLRVDVSMRGEGERIENLPPSVGAAAIAE